MKQKQTASFFSQNQNNAFDSIGNKSLPSSSRNFEIIVTPQELLSISSNEKIPDILLKIDSDRPSSITKDDLERIRSNGLITRPSFDNNCLSLTDSEDKSNQVIVKRKLLLDCIESLKKEIEFIENQLLGKEVNLDQNTFFNLKIKIKFYRAGKFLS